MDDLRFGLGLWQGVGVNRLRVLARLVEEVGFDQLWCSNHKLYADMWVDMAVAAMETSRLRIGSFVAEPYSQHPAQIAAAIATIDELSDGRAILGIGAGGANFKELGIELTAPARALAETIQIVRPMLDGETVDHRGRSFTAAGVGLRGLSARPEIPIVLASRGDRVLQLAGELADGAMVAPYATPRGLAHGREMVCIGAERAGRDVATIPLYTRVDVSLDTDGLAARDAVRPMIAAMVMASYPDQAFLNHAGLEITPALAEMAAQKNETLAFQAGHLVPDEYVEQFAWVGTPDDVARQIAAVVDSGFRNVVVLMQPMRVDPGASIRTFATEVMPRVRALVS
jgi:5,10-methylenetetrahydromethanopterin reductase